MKLKRANAIVALILLVALCCHAAFECFSLWTGYWNEHIVAGLGITVTTILVIHVTLVLIIFFFLGNHEIVDYKKENSATMIQRITAILILFFIHFHFFAFSWVATQPAMGGMEKFLLALTQVLFFACLMSHIAVSTGEAFITAKIVHSAQAVHKIDRVVYVICAVVFVVAVSGAIRYFLLY